MGHCSICQNLISGCMTGMITTCCDLQDEFCNDCLDNPVFRGGLSIELQKKIIKEVLF